MEEKKKKNYVAQPGPITSFVTGGFGGMALIVVGHPLDTIKVRMQTMVIEAGKPPPYTGIMDCARKIIAADGPMGLYAGVAAPLVGVPPMYALCFFGYNQGKRVFCDEDAFDTNNLKMHQIGLAGATSAIFTTPIMAPGERAKCILQVNSVSKGHEKRQYKGTIDVFKTLYREHGFLSCIKGWEMTVLRDAVASFFYFSVYEFLKVKLTPMCGGKDPSAPPMMASFFAGGFAGMANWAGALPLDTIKSRYQVAPESQYSGGILGSKSVLKDIVKKDGVFAVYRGASPIFARAFPANAACFMGMEASLKVMKWFGLEKY